MRYIINSANRSTGSSTYFVIPVYPTIQNPRSVSLKWASIPNSLYTIRTGINDQLVFTTGGSTYTITIPASAYDINTLSTTIAALMLSASGTTFTVAYSTTSLCVTISTSAVPFLINFSLPGSCATALRFAAANSSTVTSLTGQYAANLVIDYLFINISELSGGIFSSNGSTTFLIPVTADSGNMIIYTESTMFGQKIELNKNSITNLTVGLYLKNNELVNLNGVDWQCMLEFE